MIKGSLKSAQILKKSLLYSDTHVIPNTSNSIFSPFILRPNSTTRPIVIDAVLCLILYYYYIIRLHSGSILFGLSMVVVKELMYSIHYATLSTQNSFFPFHSTFSVVLRK